MLCDQPDGLLYKINLTRQQLQDETSINVKTLNRTISQLKEEGFIQGINSMGRIELKELPGIIKKIIKRL